MKTFFLITTYLILLDSGCKHKNAGTATTNKDSAQVTAVDSSRQQNRIEMGIKTKGKVSHRYAAKGCAVVIDVRTDAGEEMVLIPRTPLENKFDKDGLELHFNYHPVKMIQPAGCDSGMPAEITDITLQ
jgi:hypothetical protein